ncbi:hypothetical protein TCAL_13050 [Tigriopus californicus]|uniref:non-specific serine/threonine protein kinase n=1 Tax=Tigriopus californicus TaxID=6832 RepID=A0A553P7H7_TIGCA|nr:serine/threonine-protein kinase STK11-like [Tigriopus californicus]TRY73629.1 hypothetical protein TCAL_13050 [Tigriopus californicus]|eukprot:TCALIF_13050-PA protein Name:"Similar to STK11 Serine/threonine-protein kinase STK11 (Homo sapiens)" AED:0.07 eAED:0.07 QI:0/-1/0/1/-1/1/1/0/497
MADGRSRPESGGYADDDGPPPTASFQLGIEDSQEHLDELQFSLVHSQDADKEDIAEEIEALTCRSVAAHGPEEGFDSLDGYSGRGSSRAFRPHSVEFEDTLSEMMTIQRVDSQDVLFDSRPKKAKIIGQYVIGDLLGEGSYAKVKEAMHQDQLIRRAIKIMKRKKLKRIPKGEENVEKEIRLLGRLSHANVMSLIEVLYNEEKGKIYLVLEYCCGVLKDMLDAADRHRFPMWQAHFYFGQLLEGLSYLYSKRVIHKDIKPGNLLLNTAHVLKICDFGVAEELDLFAPDDTITTSQGTPTFQPPEIANGADAFAGFKIDIWSSGVTLYNFVTGSYPFEGETIFRLFENIATCEFEVPSHVGPVLEDLIRGMLAKAPEHRLTLVQVQSHDWVRKRIPPNEPAVPVKLRADDDLGLSSTVLPYICDILSREEFEEDHQGLTECPMLVTGHELNQESHHANGNGAGHSSGTRGTRGTRGSSSDEKTTKCIKVRKLGSCLLS